MTKGDEPIAFRPDGSPIYDNAASVAIMILAHPDKSITVITRATNPGKGKFALPGGFQMRGESWQQAGAREVEEEIGVKIDPELILPWGYPDTDEYGHNLLFGYTFIDEWLVYPNPAEVEAVNKFYLEDMHDPENWAFETHYERARGFLFAMNVAPDTIK